MMTQLTVISEYAKLQECYWTHSRFKKPCLNASLAIEHWMGKGTWQILQNETYLLWHCITKCTAIQWLKQLGYNCKDVWKGIYHDGHEWPDVIKACKNFLVQVSQFKRQAKFLHVTCQDNDIVTKLITKYDNGTLEPIPPTLAPGKKKLVIVAQDECIVHINNSYHWTWLKGDQQPLKKKR